MRLPLGWFTDLAVLRLTGSEVTEHTDHVVVRTPAQPTYHWGNFVLVTDPVAVDDPAHWLAVFERELPTAGHRAIGLLAEPADPAAWTGLGLDLEHSDVLAGGTPPALRPCPEGYTVRALLTEDDWGRSTEMRVRTHGEDRRFESDTTAARRLMVATGHTRWFGAFAGDDLAAELGIVDCGVGPEGHVARYQSVVTAEPHRRRGLTSHLLGVAARWAGDRGCDRWVIIADDGTDANRLYRAHGFGPVERAVQAFRRP